MVDAALTFVIRYSGAILALSGERSGMTLNDYKTVLYRQEDGSWVAEVPAISGCYALMSTREEALAELNQVFRILAEEYREKGLPLPADTTEIAHA
jgi:predicted RNase H-like HicB family nuclease